MICKKLFIAVVALLGLATQSCTDRLTDFTVILQKMYLLVINQQTL